MGIRRDRKLDARGLGGMSIDVVEIEPLRIGVEFEVTAAFAGTRNDGFHVDLVRLAFSDQPSGGVTDDRDMAIVHRSDDALGLSLARKIELEMDGGNDQIEPGQDLVGQIEATVGQNIDFGSLEYGEAVDFIIQFVDLIKLARQA